MKKILLFCMLLVGCSKEKETPPAEVTHSVTYTLYSSHTPYLFGHCEDSGKTGGIDTIRTNKHIATFQVKDNSFFFNQYVSNITKHSSDSLYIKAEFDGKKVEDTFKAFDNIFSVSVQLTSAK